MAWVTVTERYEPVKYKAVKNLKCTGCGKRLRRQRTFEQTISPFNSNVTPDMTRAEAVIAIRAVLRKEAEAWKGQPVVCDPCLDGERSGEVSDG